MHYHFTSLFAILPLLWISLAAAAPVPSTRAVQSVPLAAQANISFEEAEKIALEAVPGGKIVSIERETEWGRLVYEVEVVDQQGLEWEVVIDAADGKVLEVERD
jgi:uncharacterized membrane protein YkoI